GGDYGLFTSGDGGTTWTPAGVVATVNAIAADPRVGIVFAGTNAGIFESADGGTSWAPSNDGLTNTRILSLAVLPYGTVVAGTNGGSVFERIETAAREPVGRGASPRPTRTVPKRP